MWTLVHERDRKKKQCWAGMIELKEVIYEGEVLDGTEHECDKKDGHKGDHKCNCGVKFGG